MSPADKFKVVQRPVAGLRKKHGRRSDIVDAIIETATTGKALRFSLNGSRSVQSFTCKWRNNYRILASGRLRYQSHPDGYVDVWVEPLDRTQP